MRGGRLALVVAPLPVLAYRWWRRRRLRLSWSYSGAGHSYGPNGPGWRGGISDLYRLASRREGWPEGPYEGSSLLGFYESIGGRLPGPVANFVLERDGRIRANVELDGWERRWERLPWLNVASTVFLLHLDFEDDDDHHPARPDIYDN